MTGSETVAAVRPTRATDRWPTALALVAAAGTLSLIIGQGETDFAAGVAAMACIYLVAYAAGRPAAAWPAFPAVLVSIAVLEVAGVDSSISATALLALLWLAALARGRASDGRWFAVQTSGMVVFGGLTLLALVVDARTAGVIAGLGFFLHGLWDTFHFARDWVVNRPWSEMCLVFDLLVGPALVVVALGA